MAEQQGKWLAKRLNQLAAAPAGISLPAQAFEYRSMGSMATVGSSAAVLQGPPSKGGQTPRCAAVWWLDTFSHQWHGRGALRSRGWKSSFTLSWAT